MAQSSMFHFSGVFFLHFLNTGSLYIVHHPRFGAQSLRNLLSMSLYICSFTKSFFFLQIYASANPQHLFPGKTELSKQDQSQLEVIYYFFPVLFYTCLKTFF